MFSEIDNSNFKKYVNSLDEEEFKVIELGKKAKDKVTGFEGIIIGRIEYLFGCNQYGLTPPAKDGKTNDTQWFDEGRIEVIGNGVSPKSVKVEKNGGVNRDCPR
jgi:hypothetical protein